MRPKVPQKRIPRNRMESKLRETTLDGKAAYVFECPHCGSETVVAKADTACGIFRHAQRKDGAEVSPHAPKDEILQLQSSGLIWGCGGPFQIADGVAKQCDYI